jgi:SAM-dependent methyltransferase
MPKKMNGMSYKLIAPFYDILASNFVEDAKLWSGLIAEIKQQKESVVIYELGVGTGRVLEQVLDELGSEDKYIGIDISQELVSILDKKIVWWSSKGKTLPQIKTWLLDIRELDTRNNKPKADLIICPYSSLQHLTRKERNKLYKIVYSIAKPKGKFVFDDSTPSLPKIEASSHIVKSYIQPTLIYSDEQLGCYQISNESYPPEKCSHFMGSFISTWDEKEEYQKFTWIVEYWNHSNLNRVIEIHHYYPIPPLQTVLDLGSAGFVNIEVWTDYKRKAEMEKYWETDGTFIIKAVKEE